MTPANNSLWRRISTPAAHYIVDSVKDDEVNYRSTLNDVVPLTMPLSEWNRVMEELFDDDLEIY